MRIDFATLAFGYSVKVGGGTPNWATSLGQGKEYKINNEPSIDEILKGMVYSSVPLSKISTKIGKGGRVVVGDAMDSPIILAAVFSEVYINDVLISNGKYILLLTRDTTEFHNGRLRLKYGPSNTYNSSDQVYSNQDFHQQLKQQLSLADDACYFISDISISNQNELRLKMIIVNAEGSVEYENSKALHDAWQALDNTPLSTKEDIRISTGENVLLYGVPGSGKSWTIEHEYCKKDSIVERLVFHPDYTNADFIGQILPNVNDEQVTYEFMPGPFTTILQKAHNNPDKSYILIIEEINRGNAPAIFGEVFQLLDRKVSAQEGDDGFPVGTSEFGITHKDIAKIVYGNPEHKVRIPSNLSILATMNTSDQNVFTLDTAFQRRWAMRLIENSFDNVSPSLANANILDTGVSWKIFCETVNKIIIGNKAKMASAEDKRLGVYFVHEQDLEFDDRAIPSNGKSSLLDEYNDLLQKELSGSIVNPEKSRLTEIREATMNNRLFPEKVIKYLWDDAFKFNPEALFDSDMDSLEKVIRAFIYSAGHDRFKIFKQSIRDELYTGQQ